MIPTNAPGWPHGCLLPLLAAGCLLAGASQATQPTGEPGLQAAVARWTDTAPVVDGDLAPGEYGGAIPLQVTFEDVTTYPGVIPGFGASPAYVPPSSPDDLSFQVSVLYDADNLYVCVEVADDLVIDDGPDADGPCPYCDDDVELFVDGDGVGNDLSPRYVGTEEGFQIAMDVGGDALTQLRGGLDLGWEGAAGRTPRGYLIEFRVPLASIDTRDGRGEQPPRPGDSIGFNVAVGDDDNGGWPYNLVCEGRRCDYTDGAPFDTFGKWDGAASWDEGSWGTLYFEPPAGGRPAGRLATARVEPGTWARVKSLLK
jgi:hypothetical protein